MLPVAREVASGETHRLGFLTEGHHNCRVTPSSTILCRVHGKDGPGITAGLMAVLAESGADLYDVEQVVTRGRLTLDILFVAAEGKPTVKDLLFYAWERGLGVDFEVVEAQPGPDRPMAVVTVVGREIGPPAFGSTASAIAAAGANIERIVRLSRYPVVSYELVVSDGDIDDIRLNVVAAAAANGFDVAVQEERLERRMKRLIVIDVDSTLVQDEVIDRLAEAAGKGPEVAAITDAAMEGEIDFEKSLRRRVALLAGLETTVVETIAASLQLTPGARTLIRTLRRAGLRIALVSGGFTTVVGHIAGELEVDHAVANTLEVEDGHLTGRVVGEIVDRAGKARILSRIAATEGIPLEQVVAVGDGANDLDMLALAGLGIAFNARSAVREAADASLNVPYLDAILFLLGIRSGDVESVEEVPVVGLPPM